MAVDTDKLIHLLKELEAETDKGGWDQPAKTVVVVGTEEEPTLLVSPDMPDGKPVDILMEYASSGHVLSQDIHGIGLLCEAWGAPLVTGIPLQENLRPSENPERVEMRMLYVLLRDNRVVHVARSRGGGIDVSVSEVAKDSMHWHSATTPILYALMHGTWPEGS